MLFVLNTLQHCMLSLLTPVVKCAEYRKHVSAVCRSQHHPVCTYAVCMYLCGKGPLGCIPQVVGILCKDICNLKLTRLEGTKRKN